jgi:hypothetical protein
VELKSSPKVGELEKDNELKANIYGDSRRMLHEREIYRCATSFEKPVFSSLIRMALTSHCPSARRVDVIRNSVMF